MLGFWGKTGLAIVIVAIVAQAGPVMAREILPSHLTYATRTEKRAGVLGERLETILDQIDISSGRILQSYSVPGTTHSFTVIDDKTLCIAMGSNLGGATNRVELFDTHNREVIGAITPRYSDPLLVFPAENKIFVLTETADSVNTQWLQKEDYRLLPHPVIEVYDLDTLTLKRELHLAIDEQIIGSIGWSGNLKKIFLTPQFLGGPGFYLGRLIAIDTRAGAIERSMNYPSGCASPGTPVQGYEGKIYVPAVYASPKLRHAPIDDVFVFSGGRYEFIHKIKTVPAPTDIVSVPAFDRIYVANSGWGMGGQHQMAVIDSRTDTVIKKLAIPGFRKMGYVGMGKLLVAVSGGNEMGPGNDPAIWVIDVKSNTVIQKILGDYDQIAIHPIPWEGEEIKTN